MIVIVYNKEAEREEKELRQLKKHLKNCFNLLKKL